MTKADLVDKIFEKIGLSKKEAQEIIEILFDTMKQTFVEGESVKISGFGTFNVRNKVARRGRNPKNRYSAPAANLGVVDAPGPSLKP